MLILQRLENESTPLIDGHTVTFVWEGEKPPLLRGDFNGWNQDPGQALFGQKKSLVCGGIN